MIKQISLDNVISGRVLDNTWRDMTEIERIEALEQIKNVLLGGCRCKNTKIIRSITRMSLSNLPNNIGLFRRLYTNKYVAGQDYIYEMNLIKSVIRDEC